jgi:hypothetical protein
MKTDILALNLSKSINNKYAVTSVLPTGSYSKLLVRANYPADLIISSIESKFAERFDDPSYYYGSNIVNGGNYYGDPIIDGGDI